MKTTAKALILISESGASMLLVLAVLAVGGIIAETRMVSNDAQQQAIRTRRLNVAKDYVIKQLNKYSSIPATYRASAVADQKLRLCLLANNCPSQPVGFAMMNPLASSPVQMGGPAASPAYFDQYANPCPVNIFCKLNRASYPISVVTEYVGGNSAVPPFGPTIQIQYTVTAQLDKGSGKYGNTGAPTVGSGPTTLIAAILATGVIQPSGKFISTGIPPSPTPSPSP